MAESVYYVTVWMKLNSMAVEFAVNREYDVGGNKIDGTKLLELAKLRSSSEYILKDMIGAGKSELEARSTVFRFLTYNNSGQAEEVEIMVDEGLKAISVEDMKKYEHLYGYINYPISRRVEEYLQKLAQDAVDGEAHRKLLLEFKTNQGIKGDISSDLRADETGAFYELDAPLYIDFDGNSISTDDLFDLILGFDDGGIADIHLFAVLGFGGMFEFGSVQASDYQDILLIEAFQETDKRENIIFKPRKYGIDTEYTEQLTKFFSVALEAYKANQALLIDR
jgi:hypothetical protein